MKTSLLLTGTFQPKIQFLKISTYFLTSSRMLKSLRCTLTTFATCSARFQQASFLLNIYLNPILRKYQPLILALILKLVLVNKRYICKKRKRSNEAVSCILGQYKRHSAIFCIYPICISPYKFMYLLFTRNFPL